ncbi:hypothetical protein L210DRAFT_3655963 [Boletus edulis BED1]|uniref:Uncharacterized protein n=1 Tax=Boletus edulis BED1 TaxID=1328754 RepID=A0AAD4BBJ7_BOLED|nr:hypothetical protein L210DRAFT_3655963 [Boletus edulis BED1]
MKGWPVPFERGVRGGRTGLISEDEEEEGQNRELCAPGSGEDEDGVGAGVIVGVVANGWARRIGGLPFASAATLSMLGAVKSLLAKVTQQCSMLVAKWHSNKGYPSGRFYATMPEGGSEIHNMLSQRKSKEHIDARKHKAKVREDRMKNREPVMKELFDLRRASAFKSNYEDFKSYIDYQARLQHLDDHDTLSPSASLTGLRLKEDTPSLSHRHSFSDYADLPFLENAKKKLLRTLASPPTKPFSTYEWLRQEAQEG